MRLRQRVPVVAPHAQVAHGPLGWALSLDDQPNRPARPLADGDVLDIGGATLTRRLVGLASPPVPHNWESHMFFERETGTLFRGGTQSPYDFDLLADEDETGPEPLRRELDEEQVRDER